MAIDNDISQEQEMLDSIVQEANNVLARMDAVKTRFEQAGDTIERLNTALAQARELVATTAGNVEDTVNSAMDNIRDRLEACSNKHSEFFEQINTWTQSLGEAQSNFDQSAQATQEALANSKSIAEQLLEKVQQTASDFQSTAQDCVNDATEHVSNLADRYASEAQPAMDEFDDFLDNLRQEAESFVDDAGSQLENLQNEADNVMHEQLINPVSEHVGDAIEFLGNLGSQGIDGAIQAILAQGREALEQGVNSAIDELLQAVGSGIDQVIESIHKSGDDNELMREALRPIFDVIEELIGPIEETMGNVNSIAGAVGYEA
jgi:ABC-type transporter Mla subunit MlaD